MRAIVNGALRACRVCGFFSRDNQPRFSLSGDLALRLVLQFSLLLHCSPRRAPVPIWLYEALGSRVANHGSI
jgi:hypothetical protein